MSRIIAIDYGSKRVGVAVTDPQKIIANPLTTVHSKDILSYLNEYIQSEEVERIVVGDPKNLDNTPAQSASLVEGFINALKKAMPDMPISRIDERFTSKIAKQTILTAGKKKKDRQDKELVDKVSAVIILQSYLEANST